MIKHIVLDSSVLMHEPESVFAFEENKVIIPATVIEELNYLKGHQNALKAKSAQDVLKILQKLIKEQNAFGNKELKLNENGGTLTIELNHISFEKLKGNFDKDIGDNRILAVAKNYASDYKDKKTILVTNDFGLYVKAWSVNVEAEEYYNDQLINKIDEAYLGYRDIIVSEHNMADFYQNGKINIKAFSNNLQEELKDSLNINEFLRMRSELDPTTVATGRVVERKGELIVQKLLVTKNNKYMGISPLSIDQEMAMDLLVDDNVKLISLIGPAGTGKTLLPTAVSLDKVQEGKFRKILALKSLSAVGGEDPGFLPGDLGDKLDPYMESYYDNLEFMYDSMKEPLSIEEILNKLGDQFQVASTGLMRGRTLPGMIIIIDEAQNLTKHEIKTLITRVGKGSKIILCGDPTQIDNNYLNSLNNGLVYANERMKVSKRSGTVFMSGEGKRSGLAAEATVLLN